VGNSLKDYKPQVRFVIFNGINCFVVLYNAINKKERPNYLSRSNNLSTGLDEPVKPKFTRSAKGKPC